MARYIQDPLIVKGLIQYPRERRQAWRAIRREGYYIDVYWDGSSNEALEKYCKENRLPLPGEYKEKWDFAMTKCNSAA